MTARQLSEIRRMHADGLPMTRIAALTSIPYSTIVYWLSPGQRERMILAKRKARMKTETSK